MGAEFPGQQFGRQAGGARERAGDGAFPAQHPLPGPGGRGGQAVRLGGHGQDLLQVVGELTAGVRARQFGHGGQFLGRQIMAGLTPQGPGQVLQRGHGGEDPAEDDLEDVTGGREILLLELDPEVVERAEQVLAPLVGIGDQPRMCQFPPASGKPSLDRGGTAVAHHAPVQPVRLGEIDTQAAHTRPGLLLRPGRDVPPGLGDQVVGDGVAVQQVRDLGERLRRDSAAGFPCWSPTWPGPGRRAFPPGAGIRPGRSAGSSPGPAGAAIPGRRPRCCALASRSAAAARSRHGRWHATPRTAGPGRCPLRSSPVRSAGGPRRRW